ncbi:hypothetical protein [Mycolicibacterium vanbaalenii]|uniref:hypothetical protein n=1 Tax=Mycolicibacterium vanbaalenii TaxID=110539 RepID=UPI0023BAEAD2|nr:hypothetical protein [Mycolicibacterium vanbaalenii]
MGLFDFYSDLMQHVGESMQRVDPFGPMGAAGEAVTSLFAVGNIVGDHGTDAMWNLAGDAGDVASVAQSMLPFAKQTLIIEGGLKMISVMEEQSDGGTERRRERSLGRRKLQRQCPSVQSGWRHARFGDAG